MNKLIITISLLLVFGLSNNSFANIENSGIDPMEKTQIALAEYQSQKNMIAEVQKKADALINSLVLVITKRDRTIKELEAKLEAKE